MTRIAAGTAIPNQPSIDDRLTGAVNAATSVETERTRSSGDAGPDRPAPLQCLANQSAPADATAFVRGLRQWEGEVSFMYVDTRGYVTTGIGHLLKSSSDAEKLPWRHSTTGQPATPAEIRCAFERLSHVAADYKREHPDAKGLPLKTAERVSDLVLPDGYATKLAATRVNGEFLKGLRHLFPAFDSFPMPAQRALVDMSYSLGVGGIEHKFPKLVAACREPIPDFATAAAESHRSSSRESRNRATNQLFLEAARLTQSIQVLPREIRS
jgi:GH24 family phage-related lysozyme (muramidase)